MKKLLLLSILFFSISAFAIEWHKVGEADGKSFYVDVDNIKQQSGFVYYWELVDFKEPIFGTLSTISKFKADCSKKKKAMLVTTSYTGQMGKYFVTNEAEYDGTSFADSSKSIQMKFACELTR